jgi:hypothetical protein
MATIPAATAAAGPPLEPPVDRLKSQGLRVGSNPGGSVVAPFDSCGHAPFPMTEKPPLSKRLTNEVVPADLAFASRSAATPTQ